MKWNPLQEKLIKITFNQIHNNDKDTIKVFAHGGKGSGKSVAILWMINQICERTPGITCLIVRRTFQGLKTDTINILKRQPYPGILSGVKGVWKSGIEEFHYDNGSIIYFKHLENNEELTHGPSMGLIYIEEIQLCNKDDYDMLKLRLRQFSKSSEYNKRYKLQIQNHTLLPAKNYLFLSANPRGGWVFQEFIKDRIDKDIVDLGMPTSANISNLPSDYVNPYATEMFKRRNYDGVWEGMKGLIYPNFTAENQVNSNIIDLINIPTQNNYVIIDPGYVISKFAIMFACVLGHDIKFNGNLYTAGTVYIYDEICFNGKDVDENDKKHINEIAQIIKQKINEYKLKDYMGIIDPAGNKRGTLGPSETQQLISAGIHIKNARKTQEQASIDNINSMLKQRKIIVGMNCLNFMMEIESYSYKLDNSGEVDRKEQPEDKNNDMMDCFRYLMNELPFIASEYKSPVVGYNTNYNDKQIMESWSEQLFKNPIEEAKKQDPLKQPYVKGLTYGLPNV